MEFTGPGRIFAARLPWPPIERRAVPFKGRSRKCHAVSLFASRASQPLMVEDVRVVIPPFQIEFSPIGKEGEAGVSKLFTPFALKKRVEFVL
jgi:hypothetical protein